MWHSLRFRLLLATILVVLIAVGVTAFVATRRTTGEFQRYVERRSPLDDRRLAFFLARTYNQTRSWDGMHSEVAQLAQISGQRVVVADGDRKIDPEQGRPRYVATVPGVGYRFEGHHVA